MSKTILVTGAAGFIGSHVSQMLLERGDRVIGLDNLNDYYDPSRKQANLAEVKAIVPDAQKFIFVQGDIRDRALVGDLFEQYAFDGVIHLAAMAGVRVSIENPYLYYDVNVNGTLTLLEAAVGRLSAPARATLPNFVFAGTSSAYGATQRIPFVEDDPCNTPLAPYAASKRAAELLGYSYFHLYKQPFTVLRFFNVYGPRGRPDMMAYKVLDNMFFGREVPLYNNGQVHRDWTYVKDIAKGVVAAVDRNLGYEVINIGRGQPVLLAHFVELLEKVSGRKANLVPAPMPDADILYTFADTSKAERLLSYLPQVSVKEGIERFWEWYQQAVLAQTYLTAK